MQFNGDLTEVQARWRGLAERSATLRARAKELKDSEPKSVIELISISADLVGDLAAAAESDLVDSAEKLEVLTAFKDPEVRDALDAAGPRLQDMLLVMSLYGYGLYSRPEVKKVITAATRQLTKLNRHSTKILKAVEKHLAKTSSRQRTLGATSRQTSASKETSKEPPRYIHFERLGEGVYGEVWAAHDTLLKRRVAIKFIHSSSGEHNAVSHARALARVKHPNIVTVHDVSDAVDPATELPAQAVVMELVEGPPLSERLGREMSAAEVRRIGSALLDVVAAYHGNGLAHMDLHDGNVIVGEDSVKVIDPLYFDTAAFVSTASRTHQQGRDVREVRDLLRQMLHLCGVSLDAAQRFERETVKPTVDLLREKLDEALGGSGKS